MGSGTRFQVSLCGGDKCCPQVEIDSAARTVKIGEAGNLATLDARAWNELVAKIKSGELTSL